MAHYDPSTGIFTPEHAPVHIPTDLSIPDFLFSHSSPASASGYVRPMPPLDPERPLLIDLSEEEGGTGRSYTWNDTQNRMEAIAKGLRGEFGIGLSSGKEQVVGVYCENAIDFGPVCWGTFRCGGVVSPANPTYTPTELAYQLKLVTEHHPFGCLVTSPNPTSISTALEALRLAGLPSSKLVLMRGPSKDGYLSLDHLVNKWRTSPPVPRGEKWKAGDAQKKTAFLCFSSGTTGLPKAVNIPHVSLVANVLQMAQAAMDELTPQTIAKMNPSPKFLGVLPFYHIYALVAALHLNIYRGIPFVVIPKFTMDGMLKAVAKHKVTHLLLVPPQVVLLAKSPLVKKYDIKHIRSVSSAAAPLTSEIAQELLHRFPQLYFGQGYGMTETCTCIAYPSHSHRIVSSSGRLIGNLKAKVVDPQTGKLLGPAPVRGADIDKVDPEVTMKFRGELWSYSPSNALGYLGNDKATKETFDEEGYVHTGDEVYFDLDGNLYITDRIKELIKVKGNQVAPAELEGHILGHPDVLDAGVIGMQDDFAGELPRAYIVLKPEPQKRASEAASEAAALTNSIKKWVSDHKIRYKWLDGGVVFIDAIPKNPSGKILRKDLRVRAKTEQGNGAKAKL